MSKDNMDFKDRQFIERRKGPDLLIKFVRWTAIAGWILLIAAILILGQAQPPWEKFFYKVFGVQIRYFWDTGLSKIVFCLLIFLDLLCAGALFANMKRSRRKTDRYNFSVILLAIVTLAGILLYIANIDVLQ